MVRLSLQQRMRSPAFGNSAQQPSCEQAIWRVLRPAGGMVRGWRSPKQRTLVSGMMWQAV
jgi:hypothetical protein